MKLILQRSIQILFLIVFSVLVFTGKMQLWIALFLAGILVSIFFGRLYCGWICPINTLTRTASWLKKKLSIKGFGVPKFIKNVWTRYIILTLFIGLFIFTMATDKKLPVLPGLLAVGVLFSAFFNESGWHRYLCPYGTLFHLVSARSKYSVQINQGLCTNCGLCERICPADAITKFEDTHRINKKHCLVCLDCTRTCNKDAIKYQA